MNRLTRWNWPSLVMVSYFILAWFGAVKLWMWVSKIIERTVSQ